MHRYDVINAIAHRIGATRYLELGVQEGHTFRRIDVPYKVGVDPAVGSKATLFMTSDEYFESLGVEREREQFDIVFVDGLHTRAAVAADIRNSLSVLAPGGAIVLHDCSPPTALDERLDRCGTVWRAWVELRSTRPGAFVIDTDLGCGVIGPWQSPCPPPTAMDPYASWETFAERRARLLNLVTTERFLELLAGGSGG